MKSRTGFSLGEMLVTVMIIGLVTAAIAGGSGVIRNVYRNITIKANAEVAESTAITALQNYMRYAGSYEADNHTFIDMNTGYRMRIYNSKGSPSRVYIQYYNADGTQASDSSGTAVSQPLIPDAEFGRTLGSSLEMYIVSPETDLDNLQSITGDMSSFVPKMDANGTFSFGLVVLNHDTGQNTYTVMAAEKISIHSLNTGS